MSERRVYIVSTGRAGSTYLSRLLDDVVPGGLGHQESGSRPLNIAGHAALQFGAPVLAGAVLRQLRGERPESTSDPLASTALVLSRAQLSDPDDLFIHVVRDAREVVRSFMNWKRASSKRTVLHHVVPLWQPSPLLELGPLATARMSKPERFAWVWARKNAFFESALTDHPGYSRFRFEDVAGESAQPGELARLHGLVGAEPPAAESGRVRRTVNASAGSFPAWSAWEPSLAAAVQRRAGALMQKYGYGDEPSWQAITHSA